MSIIIRSFIVEVDSIQFKKKELLIYHFLVAIVP